MKSNKQKDNLWFPSQLALVLGVPQREILGWIDRNELRAKVKGKVVKISENDLIQHLVDYPEHVGRVYCDDLVDSINQFRAMIVRRIEAVREKERRY